MRLPRIEGGPALLASGLFAVAGVMTAIGSVAAVVMVLARHVPPESGITAASAAGAISILCFFLHRRAERSAGARRDSDLFPLDRTIAVTIVPEGNWIRRLLEGVSTGSLVVHQDHLFVRLRHQHPDWPLLGWSVLTFAPDVRVKSFGYLFIMAVSIAEILRKEESRHPWSEIPGVVSCGTTLVVEFAAADGRKDLVVAITKKDRDRILPLLRERTAVEVRPEPPKPERPKRPPPPPRPPKPPKTSIDGDTVADLDRALDGMRKLDA